MDLTDFGFKFWIWRIVNQLGLVDLTNCGLTNCGRANFGCANCESDMDLTVQDLTYQSPNSISKLKTTKKPRIYVR